MGHFQVFVSLLTTASVLIHCIANRQMLIGGIVLGVLALLVPSRPIQWTASFLLTIAYILLLATVFGWVLWLYILKHLSAGVASLGMMAVPVLSVLFSRVHFGEQPNAAEIAGMLVITAALALLSWLLTTRDGQKSRIED